MIFGIAVLVKNKEIRSYFTKVLWMDRSLVVGSNVAPPQKKGIIIEK